MHVASSADEQGPPTANGAINVSKWFELSTPNRFNLGVFLACLILTTMEGYDLNVFSAALPTVVADLGISTTQAGAIASAVSLGTLLGALLFGPMADRIGRKKVILWCTVLSCGSMAATGLSQGYEMFVASRVMFGVANGGMIVNIMALASEYVPGKSRATMIGLIACGASIGGAIGAILGIWAFPTFGWRPVFFGASILIVLLPLYIKLLPEATGYLARNNRLPELKSYLRRARPNEPLADDVPLEVDKGKGRVPLSEVFQGGRALGTFLFWICYTCNLYVIHGFGIWLPKLMIDRGFSHTRGLSFLLPLALVSIVMTFLSGRLADRVGGKPVLAALYLLTCVAILALGLTRDYVLLMILVALAGAGYNGAQNMINAYAPAYYPPSMRSTATSYNFVFGRVGGMIGPTLTGLLISAQFPFQNIMLVLALPSLVAALAISSIPEQFSFTKNLSAKPDKAEPAPARADAA